MNAQQLAAMERAMEDEHRKDREALQRLKRFLPNGNTTPVESAPVATFEESDLQASQPPLTVSEKVTSLMQADYTVSWDSAKLIQSLRAEGYIPKAKKPRGTVNRILRVLKSRGVIRLVRRGKGVSSSLYRAVEKQRSFDSHSAEEIAAIH